MGAITKIDWCDATWNPVTGCLHECEYCYARGIAKRFGAHGVNIVDVVGDSIKTGATYEKDSDGILHPCMELDNQLSVVSTIRHGARIRPTPYPYDFDPTIHRYKLDEPRHWKRPRTIFVCSMADLFGAWVPDEWIKSVFDACEAAPWHRYLFLTKNPDRYTDLAKKDMLPRQFWYGYSATSEDQLWRFHHADDCPCINLFVSIEPILNPMQPNFSTHTPADWVIVGAETGNRKGKVIPDKKWIDGILMECEYSGRPIFMKESLRGIMGDDFRQEFPWEV